MIFPIFLLLMFGGGCVYGSLTPADMALINGAKDMGSNAGQINKYPEFRPQNPSEMSYMNDSRALERDKTYVTTKNEYAGYLQKSAFERKYFAFDLVKDPVLANSNKVSGNAEAVLKATEVVNYKEPKWETRTCEESRKPEDRTCIQTLSMVFTKDLKKEYWRTRFWGYNGAQHHYNFHRYDTPYETERNHVWQPDENINQDAAEHEYNYFVKKSHLNVRFPGALGEWEKIDKKTFEELPKMDDTKEDQWVNGCGILEARSWRGECKLISDVCIEGASTRHIKEIPIYRSCWKRERLYSCQYPSLKNCDPLRAVGWEQMESQCKRMEEGKCVVWTQTLRRPIGAPQAITSKISPDTPAWSPTQTKMDYAPNTEFAEAMTHLSVLNGLQGEIRANRSATGIDGIFKGTTNQCTTAWKGFKECCYKGGGWGVSLGFAGCSGEDRRTADLRGKNLCVEVGTYCAEKIPIIGCIRKKRSYCCFGSKLARILHEQGRPQRGISFGEPEHPQCRGFTVDELSTLDFTKINFSELFDEVVSQMKQKAAGVVQRNVTTRVDQMMHTFKGHAREPQPKNTNLRSGDY